MPQPKPVEKSSQESARICPTCKRLLPDGYRSFKANISVDDRVLASMFIHAKTEASALEVADTAIRIQLTELVSE